MRPLKIQEQQPLRARLTEFALMAGFLGLTLGSLWMLHEMETQKRVRIAFDTGYKLAQKDAKAAQDNIRIDAGAIALQWWAGTNDMKEVRERLCTNVSPNAFKSGSKK